MGSDRHISSLNQSSYFCLSFHAAALSPGRHPTLEFTPKSEITFLLRRLLFPHPVHQPRLVITISPQNVPGMDLSSVMMMEVALNRSAVSVTDREGDSFNYE